MDENNELNEIQVRVLGCLIEKKVTTPDQYPLSLNALRNACNQKTNRMPVVAYEEGEVGHTLRELQQAGLVTEQWSVRVPKYEHHIEKAYDLLQRDVAVLCTLMLRGPQTVGEIKSHAHRLFAFDDLDDVHYVLNRLAGRETPLVKQLERQPGQKEERYAQLLAGEPVIAAAAAPAAATARSGLLQRVEQLEHEVAELKAALERLTSD